MTVPTITAYDWVPGFARGQVRDLRVRWAFEEVGQPYRVRYLDQGSQKEPPHRAIQPFGQVPTFECDGLALFESGAIVLHIAETHGKLIPADANGRARTLEWAFAALNSIEPPIIQFAIASLFEADRPWAKDRLPLVRARVEERLGELEARLGDKPWLEGEFSAGDLLMIAVLRNLKQSGLLSAFPTLSAYVARGEARPAFRKALADQLAGFTGSPPPNATERVERLVEAQRALFEGEAA